MSRSEERGLKGVVFDKSENTIFNIPYSDVDDERLRFDLLKASKEKAKGVLIVDIHGGAYFHGHRINNYKFSNYFREEGYDVVVADYRLTSLGNNLNVETEVRDLLSLLSYLQKHLGDYGLKKDKLVIMGDSAGGHFALLLSEIVEDIELQNKWGVDLSFLKLSATVVSCPVYDFDVSVYSSGLSKSGKDYMYGKGHEDREWTRKLDPRPYISSIKAPIFVSSCRNDFLKKHSKTLDEDLNKLGHDHAFVFLESASGKVGHVHNIIDLELPESVSVNQAIIAFLNQKV
ncbi:MAG: alpha/beta hydrolase [Bacilli bacterium]|nr:alpha/beta hydrolase [Bacilli bacterium]